MSDAGKLEGSAAVAPLVVRGVRRSFEVGERRIEILHGVDLDLMSGERLCLMGASGAGKTTLLNVIGLLDRPDEGRVEILGTDAWSRSRKRCFCSAGIPGVPSSTSGPKAQTRVAR